MTIQLTTVETKVTKYDYLSDVENFLHEYDGSLKDIYHISDNKIIGRIRTRNSDRVVIYERIK